MTRRVDAQILYQRALEVRWYKIHVGMTWAEMADEIGVSPTTLVTAARGLASDATAQKIDAWLDADHLISGRV